MIGSVRVRFVRGRGISSRAIEWFGGGGFSHCAGFLPDGSIIDARADIEGGAPDPGVQRRGGEYLDKAPGWVDVTIPCTGAQAEKRNQALIAQIGKPYDKVGIWAFVTGRIADSNWRERKAWFCDELQAYALTVAGLMRPSPLPLYRLTPGALAVAVCQLPGAYVSASKGWKPAMSRRRL